jgi:hypothetical protein
VASVSGLAQVVEVGSVRTGGFVGKYQRISRTLPTF